MSIYDARYNLLAEADDDDNASGGNGQNMDLNEPDPDEEANQNTDNNQNDDANTDQNQDDNQDQNNDDQNQDDNQNTDQNNDTGNTDDDFDINSGTDDTDTDNNQDNADAGTDDNAEEQEEPENATLDDIYSTLTDKEKAIRDYQLRKNIMSIHKMAGGMVEQLSMLPKISQTNKQIKVLMTSLYSFRKYILFYIKNTYATKTLVENTIQYYKYLGILGTYKNIFKDLEKIMAHPVEDEK